MGMFEEFAILGLFLTGFFMLMVFIHQDIKKKEDAQAVEK